MTISDDLINSYEEDKKKKNKDSMYSNGVRSISSELDNYTPTSKPNAEIATPSQEAKSTNFFSELKRKASQTFSVVGDMYNRASEKATEFLFGKSEDKKKLEQTGNLLKQFQAKNYENQVLNVTKNIKALDDQNVGLYDQIVKNPNDATLKAKLEKNNVASSVFRVLDQNSRNKNFVADFQQGESQAGYFKVIAEKAGSVQEVFDASRAYEKSNASIPLSDYEKTLLKKFDNRQLASLSNKSYGYITGTMYDYWNKETQKNNHLQTLQGLDVKEAPSSAVLTSEYNIQSPETQKMLEDLGRNAEIGEKSFFTAVTGGFLHPEYEAPKDLTGKIVEAVGTVAGSVIAIETIGGVFGSLAEGSTTVANIMSKYPTLSKYAFPILKNVLSFDVYGQLDPRLQDRFAKLSKDSLLAIPYTALGFLPTKIGKIPGMTISIPASFGLGYGLTKLDGGSDQDALIAGAILGVLDTFGRIGKKETSFVEGRYTDKAIKVEAANAINSYSDTKISSKSSVEEITKAYREAALKTHPDRPGGNNASFKRIQKAYDFLTGKAEAIDFSSIKDVPKEGKPVEMKAIPDIVKQEIMGKATTEVKGETHIPVFEPEASKYVSAKDYAESLSAKPENQIGLIKATDIVPRDPIDKTSPEYTSLKADIQKNGIKEPIRVTVEDGKIITTEGSQRTSIAQDLNIDVPVIVNNGTVRGLKTIDEVYSESKKTKIDQVQENKVDNSQEIQLLKKQEDELLKKSETTKSDQAMATIRIQLEEIRNKITSLESNQNKPEAKKNIAETDIEKVLNEESSLLKTINESDGETRLKAIEKSNEIRDKIIAFEDKNKEKVIEEKMDKSHVGNLIQIEIVKYGENNFGVRLENNISTSGVTFPFDHGHKTKQEAVLSAIKDTKTFIKNNDTNTDNKINIKQIKRLKEIVISLEKKWSKPIEKTIENKQEPIKIERGTIKKLDDRLNDLVGYRPTGQNWKAEFYIREAYIENALIDAPQEVRDEINTIESQLKQIRDQRSAPSGFASGGKQPRDFSGKKAGFAVGIEMPEMVRLAKEITGLTPEVKKSMRNALGRFYPGKGGQIGLAAAIFKDPSVAVQVLAHEIGHSIDWIPEKIMSRGNLFGRIFSLRKYLKNTFGETSITNKEVKAELIKLSEDWNNTDLSDGSNYSKYKLKPEELYADAISVLLNDPYKLKNEAPKFWELFFQTLDRKPVAKENLMDLYDLLNKGETEVLSEREKTIREMFKRGEDLFKAKREEALKRDQDYVFRVKYDHIDKNQRVIDKVNELRKKGVPISDDDNPVYALEGYNYIGGIVKNWLEDFIQPVYENIKKAGLSWEDFGETLFLERVINERGEMANPLGFTPETAKKQMEYLRGKLTPDEIKVLDAELSRFREGVKKWIDDAAGGVWSEEIAKQLKLNPSYATFQVLDYLDLNIPASIKKQVGTLKEISNPADATIIKTIGLIRAIERNKVKTKLVSFLKNNYSKEIQNAETMWNGKTHMPIEPKDRDLSLFTTMEDGKVKGYYIDPYIASTMEYMGVGNTNAILQAFKFMNSSFYRPFFITFNTGFQAFNTFRDFLRYYKNIPGMNILQALSRYGEALGPAYRRAFDIPDKTIKEMEKAKILNITYNDLIKGQADEDKQVESMLRRVGLFEGKEKKMNVFVKPFSKILDLIERTGNLIETLPKVAGYNQLNGKLPTNELASFIRTSVGSPDFKRKGAAYAWYNEIFLFSNAIKEGIRSDYNIAFKNPKTRGGYWWKTAWTTFLPKLLMFGAAIGLFGPNIKKMMDSASEYDKTNYTILPLGVDENGKTIYVRIPIDETGRFLGGILWKTLNISQSDKSVLSNIVDLMAFGSGQFPTVNPTIVAIFGALQFLTGNNPYDFFRDRNVIPDDEFKAGGKYALKPFAMWEFNTLGLGVFMNTYTTVQSGEKKTWYQKVLEAPILSNILGRFIKVSDYGIYEQAKQIRETEEQRAAVERIENRKTIQSYVDKYNSGKKNIYTKLELEKNLRYEVVGGHKPKTTQEKTKATNAVKKFRIGILKGDYNTYVDSLLTSTSNDQKLVYLKKIREEMTPQKFAELKRTLIKEQVVSKELFKTFEKQK